MLRLLDFKRFRVNTPEKVTGTSFADRLVTDIKGKIGTAALNIRTTNTKDLVVAIANVMNDTIVSAFEVQNNAISALASQVTNRDMAFNDLLEENEELRAELNNVKVIRERQEVKASIKDTEVQLREAAKQVKVLDLDFGGCLTDRKQLMDKAREALREKVRADLRADFDLKTARASLQVIARASTKREYPGGDMWTGPVQLSIPDRDTRWEVEDILRKSNCYPTYHWPKEMIEPVKILRQTIIDSGIDTNTHLFPILPEEKDSQWKIRADTKVKVGTSKFAIKARWSVPPWTQH